MTDFLGGLNPGNPKTEDEDDLLNAAGEAYLGTFDKKEEGVSPAECFSLLDVAPVITSGMETLVRDSFWQCFKSADDRPWNFTFSLYVKWILGVIFRWFILLPIRFLYELGGTIFYSFLFFCICPLIPKSHRLSAKQWICRHYSALWLSSWSCVIQYHGVKPKKHANQVLVCNHTTVFDICLLEKIGDFAIIGQLQGGFMGFLQTKFLSCTGSIWFDRKDARDRSFVARKLKEHIQDENNNPLLIFPEGTCVNNEYCIQFKRGAFELGAIVYPVAIKYKFVSLS